MSPDWLTNLSLMFLILGVVSALVLAIDVSRHPPAMTVMAFVWPLCALSGSLLVVWFYWSYARKQQPQHTHAMASAHVPNHAHSSHSKHEHHEGMRMHGSPASAVSITKGTLHCGAGCTLGDVIAEGLAASFPALTALFGYGTLFADQIFAIWCLDFILAFVIGIAFQYFAIAPMRNLGLKDGLIAALKADAASLISWQIGMYATVAIAHFWVFGHLLQKNIDAASPVFWFAMQIAMFAGFLTAYPVNRKLIATGIKEAM